MINIIPRANAQMPQGTSFANDMAFATLSRICDGSRKLDLIFDLDSKGYEIVKVETERTMRFPVLLNEEIITRLMAYLQDGSPITTDGVNPMEVEHSDEKSGNDYRKHLLMFLIENRLGAVRVYPEFLSHEGGTIKAVAYFKYGEIFFYMKKDDEIATFLDEHRVIY